MKKLLNIILFFTIIGIGSCTFDQSGFVENPHQESICDDEIDNDEDGFIDCDDQDCCEFSVCNDSQICEEFNNSDYLEN
jgi:hypothetical protein